MGRTVRKPCEQPVSARGRPRDLRRRLSRQPRPRPQVEGQPSLVRALRRLRVAWLDALLVLDEGEAHVPVAAGPEAHAGRRGHVAPPAPGTRRTRPSPSPGRARGSAPRRTSCPGAGSISQPMRLSPSHQGVAPRLVDRLHLAGVVRRLVEGDRGRDLDGLERAVVEVGLELGQRLRPPRGCRRGRPCASRPSRTTSSSSTARPRTPWPRRPAGSTAARSRRSRARRRRCRARARRPCSRAKSTMRCMKARSTQVVVGLCGNDSTMTRGLGHEYS